MAANFEQPGSSVSRRYFLRDFLRRRLVKAARHVADTAGLLPKPSLEELGLELGRNPRPVRTPNHTSGKEK